MGLWIALALVALTPNDGVLTDEFDVVEVNHVLREDGQDSFTQLIVWRFDPYDSMLHVQAWRMLDKGRRVVPIYHEQRRRYLKTFWDKHAGELRQIWSVSAFERWGGGGLDVEVLDREQFPKEYRTELSRRLKPHRAQKHEADGH